MKKMMLLALTLMLLGTAFAGSQFFIMHGDAAYLDGQYAAFGKVIEGMDVVDRIAAAPTDPNDRPLEAQRIKSITIENIEGKTFSAEKIQ